MAPTIAMPGKDQPLLLHRNALLLLCLLADVFDGVNLEGAGLSIASDVVLEDSTSSVMVLPVRVLTKIRIMG